MSPSAQSPFGSGRIEGRTCRFWHAVNSHVRQVAFLTSGANMAEGDVLMGNLCHSESPALPIMAHPPERLSDLSFEAWVEAGTRHGHGLKVDLKEREVVATALRILQGCRFPGERLLLNADILHGPGGGEPGLGIDELLACRAAYPRAIISIGCTTDTGATHYTKNQMDGLLQAAEQVDGPVTIPLRMELVLADPAVAHRVQQAGCSASIWNAHAAHPANGALFDQLRQMLPEAFIDISDASGQPVHGRVVARGTSL